MNWLPRFGGVIFLTLLLLSCKKHISSDIGQEVKPHFNSGAYFTDSIPVPAYTLWVDSLRTDSAAFLLVGNYNDKGFGNTKCIAYSQILFDSILDVKALNGANFDSAYIQLPVSYKFGDTLNTLRFTINILTQALQDSTHLSSEDHRELIGAPITEEASIRVSIKKAVFNIRVNTDFGKELFNKVVNNEINSDASMTSFLKGVAFLPSANTEDIICGFKYSINSREDSILLYSKMVIVYKDANGKSRKMTFPIHYSGKHYNSFIQDRTGIATAGIPKNGTLTEQELNNALYLQGATGLYPILDLSEVKNLKKAYEGKGTFVIDYAELLISNPEENHGLLPLDLVLIEGSDLKRKWYDAKTLKYVQRELYNPEGNNVPMIARIGGGKYRFVITNFLQNLVDNRHSTDQVILSTVQNANYINRILLDKNIVGKKPIQLKIYYSILK